jgi:hypothetical protein
MRLIGISTAVESARAVAGKRIGLVRLVAAGRSRVLAGFQSRQTTRTGVRSSPPHVSRVAWKHCSGLARADVGGSKPSDARDPYGRQSALAMLGDVPLNPAGRLRETDSSSVSTATGRRDGAMALQASARGRWRSALSLQVVPEPVAVVAFRGHGCWQSPATAGADIAWRELPGCWRGSSVLRSSCFIALS